MLRGSKRVRNRDRAAGSILAVAAVAGVFMTASTFLPRPFTLDPSPEPSLSPSAEASAGPSPSPEPSPAPSVTSSPSPSPDGGSGQLDFRNTTLEIVIPAGRGISKVTNGVGTVEINTLYDVTIHSSAILEGGTAGVVIVEIRAGQGSPLRTLHIYRIDQGMPVEPTVLGNEAPLEFYGASKVVADGPGFVVTVDGSQWRYRQDSVTKKWQRVR